MSSFLVSVVFVLFAFLGLASAQCQDSDIQLGTCRIHEHVCSGFENWSYTYQATASEPISGKSATSDQNSGGNGAAQQATWRLTTQLGLQSISAWNCNCQNQDIHSGRCNIRAVVCFYFPSQSQMTSNQPYYNGYGFDLNNNEYMPGTSTGFTNSTLAGQSAVSTLFAQHPDTARSCGQGAGVGLELTPLHLDFEETMKVGMRSLD